MHLLDSLQHWMVERRPLTLRYDGDREPRVVQPHAVFRSSEGELMLCALQVGGRTPVGGLPAWFDFELERVVAVEPLADRFRCAADFDPRATRFGHGPVAVVLR